MRYVDDGRLGLLVTRIFAIAFAIAAIAWACVVIPTFRAETALWQTARRILAGEAYKEDVLAAVAADAADRAPRLRPATSSRTAIIELRRAEDAMRSGSSEITDERLASLGQAIDQALGNAPADPFLWVVRFWLENTRTGFLPEHLPNLRMSYTLGPNEGWIATRRNRLVLAIYGAVPSDLQQTAVREFAGLVRSYFHVQAAEILAGPGSPIRDALLASLKDVNEGERRAFARTLRAKEVDDVSVPGIEPPTRRPWEH